MPSRMTLKALRRAARPLRRWPALVAAIMVLLTGGSIVLANGATGQPEKPRVVLPDYSHNYAIQALLLGLRAGSNTYSNGCAVVVDIRVCPPRVLIDNQAVPTITMVKALIGTALEHSSKPQTAGASALQPLVDDPATQRRAISTYLLSDFLELAAPRDGVGATDDQAMQLALRNAQADDRDAQFRSLVVPAGMTSVQYETAPRQLADAKMQIDVGNERRHLQAAGVDLTTWFQHELASHTIVVDGRQWSTAYILAGL